MTNSSAPPCVFSVERVVTTVFVHDMDRAMAFYGTALGLTLEHEEEAWALFTEGIVIMLSPEPLPQDSFLVNAVVPSLFVADVEKAFACLTQRGVPFFVPPTAVGSQKVATLRDSEGNMLQLVQA